MTATSFLLRTDLRTRWRSLVVLALLVAVVVAGVLTALMGARRTETAFDRYLAEVRPFDATVSAFDGGPVSLDGLEDVEGVDVAVGFRWYAAFPGDLSTQFFPMIVPDDDRVPEQFMRSPVVEGRRPDPAAPLEVALGERTARRLGVVVGDPLPMATFTAADLAQGSVYDADPTTVTARVVGILRSPGDVASREGDLDLNLLTPAFAEEYGDEVGLFSVGSFIRIEQGASTADVDQAVENRFPVDFDSFFGIDILRRQANPTLASMAVGLRIVALVIGLVGGTIALALARAAAERVADRGALRALGMDRRGLLAHLGLASSLAAGTGIVVGGAASLVLTPWSQWGLARRAEVEHGIHADGRTLVLGLAAIALLVVAAIVATGHLALRREARHHHDAARPSAVAARAAGLGAPLRIVVGLRLAFDRGRGARTTPVAAAATAAALGGLGVMAALVLSSSLQHAVTTPSVYGYEFDGVLSRVEDGDEHERDGDAALAAMVADPAFSSVAEYVLDLDITVNELPESATVLEDLTGHTPFVVVEGREPLGANEVAVGATLLAQRDLDVGDTIQVGARGREVTMRIVGTAVLPVNDDGGLSSTGVAMRREAADALGFDGTCDDGEPCSRGVALRSPPGVDLTAAADRYLPDGFAFVRPSAPSEVERLTAVDRLPRLVAAFLGVISVITIAHAAAVTVRRRRRELAMLRVLGFSGRDLRSTVRVQVASLSLLGATVGVLLGVVVGRQLWKGIASSVSLPSVITMPVVALVAVPVAIAALAQLAAVSSRWAAGRVPTSVVLRAE